LEFLKARRERRLVRVGELVTSHLAYFIGFIEGNSGGEEEMRGEGVQGGRKQPAESKEHLAY
jgi:hypothetical protein